MKEEKKIVLGISEKPKPAQWLLLSIQHLFAMFGATVLVPALTGMSPAVALISSGIGTLVFIAITKGKVPSYLGSSFAFINPIIAVKALELDPSSGVGMGSFLVGSFLVGVTYSVVALIINRAGTKWLMKLLPPVVVGPVIMVIGLGLAATAVNMATNNPAGDYDQMCIRDSLCSRCFSPFPHGTGSLSVSQEYLALPDGPGRFTQNFTCSALLRIPLGSNLSLIHI